MTVLPSSAHAETPHWMPANVCVFGNGAAQAASPSHWHFCSLHFLLASKLLACCFPKCRYLPVGDLYPHWVFH